MSTPTVVVLGGGVGGVVAAHDLRRQLKDRARIVLVDRNPQQSFAPSYLWVMTGERSPAAITRDLTSLARKGIEVLIGDVRTIDVERRRVLVGEQELAFEYLIVALGAELIPDALPGLERAHTYYQLAGAVRLREALETFEGGRIALLVAGLPYKCPAAPYEGAMLLESYFLRRHKRHHVEIAVYTPEPQPMPVAGRALGQAVQELLAHKGIAFHPNRQVSAVETNEVRFADGGAAPYDLLIAVPPHRAPPVVVDAGLTDESGWIAVDQYTLETTHESVFAIGDVTRISLPDGMALPKAGVFAHAQAQIVARNIAARMLGRPDRATFNGKGFCFLEAGAGAAGMAQGDFFERPRVIKMRPPSRLWHWGKVAFERYWLWKWY